MQDHGRSRSRNRKIFGRNYMDGLLGAGAGAGMLSRFWVGDGALQNSPHVREEILEREPERVDTGARPFFPEPEQVPAGATEHYTRNQSQCEASYFLEAESAPEPKNYTGFEYRL